MIKLVVWLICKCVRKDFFILLMKWGKKIIQFVEYLSRYASETLSAQV